MSRFLVCFALLSLVAVSAFAQQPAGTAPAAQQETDTAAVAPPETAPPPPAPPEEKPAGPKKIYYGGTLGLSMGDYFRISIQPFVGYKLKPFLHVGGKATYEYIDDSRYSQDYTSSSYGGSIFSRLMPQRSIYLHAEFAYINYEYQVSQYESDRNWVPFLYVGGGLVKQLSLNTSAYVEVLFDVLQDDNSPYEDWTPFISAGVGVGF
jgi:hypothetical protein